MTVKRVICAVIVRDGRALLARRAPGQKHEGLWEFPGGKVEAGESPEDALRREIREELETEIRVGELIDTIEYDYPDFHLSMKCYACTILSGDLHLVEHEAARWLTAEQLGSVEWLPADITLIPKIARLL